MSTDTDTGTGAGLRQLQGRIIDHDVDQNASGRGVASMKRCPMCRRTYATDADWAALAADPSTGTGNQDTCPWGGDRCWNAGACGVPAEAVVSQVSAAAALRRRRPWSGVPHLQACPA